jgi:hypothetical protein
MLFAGLLTQSIARADAPTTKPAAKRPATQPIPKDWVKIENSKYNFTFFVPPKWKKQTLNDGQATYLLPVAKNKRPPLFDLFGTDCHETTLDAEANNLRAGLAASKDNWKIIKDEATTLGGKAAWLVTARGSTIETLPPTAPNQKPAQIKQAVMIYRIMYLEGKSIFGIEFKAEGSAYSDDLAVVQRVIDSFAWMPADAKP